MPVHDADRAVAELAASQHGALARTQAAECGLTPRMIRSRIAAGVFHERFPGVVTIAGSPPTWRQDLKAATLTRPGAVAAAGLAAYALHGLDGSEEGVLEVQTPRCHRVRLPGVVVRRTTEFTSADLHAIDGIPVTSLARTLCDLGSVVGIDVVERALDDARRRGVSLRWLGDTAERLHRPGNSGTAALLKLLADIKPHQRVRDSWFEALVEGCLKSPVLPPLVRQHEVYDSAGVFIGRLDLAFPDVRLGVEAHSRKHHFGRQAERIDERRDLLLAALGWEVLYIGWQDTRTPIEVLTTIESVVEARRWVRK